MMQRHFVQIKQFLSRVFGRSAKVSPPEAAARALAECRDALAGTCRNSENAFLSLGRNLEAIHGDVTDLASEAIAAIGRTTGKDQESSLSRIDDLVRQSLNDLNVRRRDVADRLDHIDAVISRLKQLDRLWSDMARLTMNLRVMGFNIRVESSRSADSQDMFGVVSKQINLLSDNVDRNTERFREDVQDATERQKAAYDGIAGSLERLEGLAGGAAQAVQGSVQDAERLMENSMAAVRQAETHLTAISRHIGEVVAGIQIHDSMSQRIAHINNALKDAADLCVEEATDLIRYGDIAERRFAAAHSIVRLQMAQLQQIVEDVEAGYYATQRAFDMIGEEIDGLGRSLLVLKAGENDPFDALQADLFRLKNLLTEASELVARIKETADAAIVTTEKLEDHTTQVDGIGFEIRMIALNAIIKAAHLGKTGGVLEVIAQEVNVLSNETNLFVTRVKKALGGVATQVRKLDGGASTTSPQPRCVPTLERGNGQRSYECSSDALADSISQLTDAYHQFRQTSEQILVQSGNLRRTIDNILAALEFLPSLSGELSELGKKMAVVADMIKPRIKEEVRASVDEVNRLAERYTMRLERGVHQRLLGNRTASVDEAHDHKDPYETEARPKQKKPQVESDLGDNVELF